MLNRRENYLMFQQKNKVLLYGIFYGILSETSLGICLKQTTPFCCLEAIWVISDLLTPRS